MTERWGPSIVEREVLYDYRKWMRFNMTERGGARQTTKRRLGRMFCVYRRSTGSRGALEQFQEKSRTGFPIGIALSPSYALVNSITQLVSQVSPPSLEKACAQSGASGEGVHRKRTRTGTPLSVSSP